MTSLQVTLAPVALRPSTPDSPLTQLRMSTLRPGGQWLSTTLSDPAQALHAAHQMLDGALQPEVRGTYRLENAGVDYASGAPNLLVTAALPISAAELDDSPEDWPLLTPWVGEGPERERHPLLRLESVQAAMIAYWREQLLHTTAALDFLPKYFTMFQARSVYASVWGERQPHGNFQRWLGSAEDVNAAKVIREVDDLEARLETQQKVAQGLGAVTPGISAATVIKQWDPKIIGSSAAVAGLAGVASLIPKAQVVGAIVGGTVGYQRAKSTGRPPRWYTRTDEQRVDLKSWYPVRPPATMHPPTFVG